VVIGGTIPAGDERALLDLSVAAVFPVGASLQEVVDGVLAAAGEQVAR
jgi:methylmalonyl-CoA mutase cobalamin-binding subunit